MKNTLLHQATKRNSEHAPAYTNPNRRPCHQNSSMKKNCEYVKKKIDIAEEEERTETKNNLQYFNIHQVIVWNQGCNTTNVLHPSSNGNTTFALTKTGDRYFVCGNRLHCYAGMKLHVVVDGKTADGPATCGPEAKPGNDSVTTRT
ncbi:hypothetical protein E3N88_12848 [Mikania micrantha]|uniref:Phytocyanin domain-containing protein n=1 Tax=Mikania micrantha TaxID=192012 RepID=A0A5N6P802_9ASTR|nr:hypothetical protein E3N88_12848 [Mikania micrantha]